MRTYDGEPPGWDDRKTLADLWQQHAPLPDEALTDRVYAALIAVALWGFAEGVEAAEPDDGLTGRISAMDIDPKTSEQVVNLFEEHEREARAARRDAERKANGTEPDTPSSTDRVHPDGESGTVTPGGS